MKIYQHHLRLIISQLDHIMPGIVWKWLFKVYRKFKKIPIANNNISVVFTFKIYLYFIDRLRKDFFGGAWCPKTTIAPGVREWIQIDLKRPYRITRTATQGRYGSGRGQEYAEAFKLEYWRPEFGNETDSWRTYRNHSGHSVQYSIPVHVWF